MSRLLTTIALAATLLWPTVARADDGRTTAYCDSGIMADGNWTHWGAAGGAWWLPFGSLVWVEGLGVYVIEDRGSAPYTLDIWMASCVDAWQWGVQYPRYTVLRWGWGR